MRSRLIVQWTCILALGIAAAPAPGHSDEVVPIDQGWSTQQKVAWYTLSQGSRLLPLSWFRALEQPGSSRPFLETAQPEIPLDGRSVMVTMGRAGQETRRIRREQRRQALRDHVGKVVFFDAIPHVEHEHATRPQYPTCLRKRLGLVRQEHVPELAHHRIELPVLERQSHRIGLEIEDEGHGLPAHLRERSAALAASGVGIAGIQERVRELGGEVRIESQDRGTKIVVTLPVSEG